MDAMLSTSEVAELTGISLRHVKRLAASNKLPCEKTVNSNNRPKYLFPLSGLAALDPTLPQRYLAQHAQEGTAEGAAEPQNAKRGRGRPRKGGAGKTAASKPLEEYSTEERGEIAFWTQAVQDWRGYRAGYRDKAAADEAWLAQFRLDHPEVHITRKILYARQRAVLEDDLDGLVDGRGKARRGYCKIPAAWDAFMYYYLDQRQSPIKQCYDQTIYFLEQHCPEALPVPDYTTFYRHVMADVPEPVKVMGREGPKAFYDRCSHYIRREYENMQSNEYWIADTHTFDVVTKGDGGGTHRLYLTAFMDARSGIFVGCHVADTNSSQNVLTALRRGILRYGIKYHPEAVAAELALLPDSREVFFDSAAQTDCRGLTDIQRAARSLYLIKMSFGCDRRTFATAPKIAGNISASFAPVQERLRKVIIEHLDFEQLIRTYDRPNALFYCDPPYMGTEKYYQAAFSTADHERLARVLHNIRGRFLLSYNDCEAVRKLYEDCEITPLVRRNNLPSVSTGEFHEVLISNYTKSQGNA